MSAIDPTRHLASAPSAAQRDLTALMAFACGAIGMNLSAPQPLVGVIAPALGLGVGASGLVTMATFLGYGLGMLFLVPLTDLVENRRLVLRMLAANVAALLVSALAPNAIVYLLAAVAVGATTATIQMLVPMVAALAPESQRGRVVGNVMSGVMVGIMLARPLASLTERTLGWRGVFALSALMIAALLPLLRRALPTLQPADGLHYGALVRSLWPLIREERVLRRRTLSAILAFGAFNAFWTIIALRLAQPPFDFGQRGIAAFALAGVGGIVSAPIAGRLGDGGHTRIASVAMHLLVIVAMLLAGVAGGGFGAAISQAPALGIALLIAASLLLDLGMVGDQTLGRRAVNVIRPEARGRLNGLYTGGFFVGGASASAVAGVTWSLGGWGLTCAFGAALGLAALAVSLGDLRRRDGA